MSRVATPHAVTTADGTQLATDVYLPEQLPAPVVVTRTPYDRSTLRAHGRGWTRRGIAFVAQDVRGRYGSEGTWDPYCREDVDGAATLRWVHQQTWCDGHVFPAGASYGSFTAWSAAIQAPDLVSGVISEVPAAGLRAANVEPSGILRLAEYRGWWSEHAKSRTSRPRSTAALSHLPVAEMDAHWWSALASSPVEVLDLTNCAVPSLHIGGWYDLFLPQTLQQWNSVGSRHTSRPPKTLVIGPWTHELSRRDSHSAGGRDHGPDSQLRLGDLQADWITSVTGGVVASSAKVFLIGGGRWLNRWPASTSVLRLFTTVDRTLHRDPPDADSRHHFTDNPAMPFPSLPPSHDRSILDGRPEALSFRSDVLTKRVVIVGTPIAYLSASSTAPQTDWIVRLVHRLPDGQALDISSGTAISTNSTALAISMTPTALVVESGSRLEFHISSSDFPRLARNLNTGTDRYTTTAMTIAHQTIHSGPESGTWLELPVLEEQ